jgi:hypothetical protein
VPEAGFDGLLARYRAAATSSERYRVLAPWTWGRWSPLDEGAAVALYELDPAASREFILKHLPTRWPTGNPPRPLHAGTLLLSVNLPARGPAGDPPRQLWKELGRLARERGDEAFFWALYRKQVPLPEWEQDALELCDKTADPGRLVEALEQEHPEGWYLYLDDSFYRLLKHRGRDVLPYVLRHLDRVPADNDLLDLAEENNWLDLWAGLRSLRPWNKGLDAEVARLAADCQSPEPEVVRRLLLLAGISERGRVGLPSRLPRRFLADQTAVALYQRFPDLLRGPFRMCLAFGAGYAQLTAHARDAADEPLVDFLASRVVPQGVGSYNRDLAAVVEAFTHYYEKLLSDSQTFARRAAAVLGQVPAHSIYNPDSLVRSNTLARLLFGRLRSRPLDDPQVIRDLLESPEVHVKELALKALGRDDDRARECAAHHLDLLEGALWQWRGNRRERRLAFRALLNAATTPENARRIYDRARQALELPGQPYPKEPLVTLLGGLLHRWPDLRGPREQPVVYPREAS